jgi:uncharacterized membrane protein
MIVLEGLRVVFGSLFVLFLPGFAWSFVFFDKAKKEIDWLERGVLSIGLSIALVPLAVFWFNWVLNVKITLLHTILIVLGLIAAALFWLWGRKRGWWNSVATRILAQIRRK